MLEARRNANAEVRLRRYVLQFSNKLFAETVSCSNRDEWSELGSRDIDGQTCDGSRRMRGAEFVNLYRYCGDDPVDRSDPLGLETLTRPEIDEQVGNRVVQVSQFIGHQIAEAYREDPIGFIFAIATMGRGPKVEGPGGSLRGLGNPFKGKTAAEAVKMIEGKGFLPRGPDPAAGKGGYVNPKNDRSYHIDPNNRHGEPPHVDVNRPKDYNGPLEKKKLPLKDN